jgi:flagellin
VATATSNAVNLATYRHAADNAFITDGTAAEIVTFQNERGAVTITLNATNGNNLANSLATLNTNLAALGIYAVADGAGTGISIQSATSFSIFKQQAATAGAVIDGGAGAKAVSEPAPTASATGNALAALSALTSAVSRLGLVQGRVGTGQNKLQYAIALAQSQITNFSAAQSRIRDADVAAEAANLTKAQVLQQASLAALAQANAAPQSVLTLLRG